MNLNTSKTEIAENNQEETTWMNPLLITLAIGTGIVLVVLFGLIFFGKKNKTVQMLTQKTTPPIVTQIITPTQKPTNLISGTIIFQGYTPPEAYIAIAERIQGKTDFKDVVSGLIPGKDTSWTWNNALHGTNYEIIAELKIRGKTVQESPIVAVSAPATAVELSIVSEQNPPQPQTTAISGTVHLEGYIPSKSTITVLSRISGAENFATIISGLPAQDTTAWNWNKAVSGKTYDIVVKLQNASGIPISSDTSKTITAPSSGLSFFVSSTAQPAKPIITGLSGKILINGDIPPNSYVTLGTRQTGKATFTQVGNTISATNGISWSWGNAQSGIKYDVQAYLWVNGKPYAQSIIVTLTAPSQNNQLTINAQQQISAPSENTIHVTCNGQQNGQFQATINYNTNASLQNVQQYTIVVTLASQGNQVISTTITPGNPDQSQSLTTGYQFTSGVTYYAQYAYATKANSNSFSPLSPAIQFSCR